MALLFISACFCAIVDNFLGGFVICILEAPLTEYLFLLENAPLLVLVIEVEEVGVVASLVCLGTTNAFVCLSKYLSLHKADIKGKSRFRLFSRRVRMSNIPSSFFSSRSPAEIVRAALFGVVETDVEAAGSG